MLGKRLCLTVIGAAVLFALIGCGDKRINLIYSPHKIGPFQKAQPGKEVAVNKFKDGRTQKSPIAEAKNSGGTVFYIVETDSDVSAWVTNAVAAELQKAGFRVATGENADSPDKFIVNGVVSHVYAGGVISEMRATVQIAKNYKILLNKSYSTEGSKSGRIFDQNVYLTDYVKLFDLTLQDLLEEMIPQMIAAMNSAP